MQQQTLISVNTGGFVCVILDWILSRRSADSLIQRKEAWCGPACATYRYWTFNQKVPGPFICVRVGDPVEVRLKNHDDSVAGLLTGGRRRISPE
ncbi:MAG: multicopper oxidase domain-containing protein [Pseudolabrys sp.]